MTQAKFAEWLGCSKAAVVAWEVGRNTIPEWLVLRIKSDGPVMNPKFSLSEFKKIQEMADSEGISVDDWISNVIKSAIKLLLFLCLIAKLIQSPTDWSLEHNLAAIGTGFSWFATGANYVLAGAWELGGSLLASM